MGMLALPVREWAAADVRAPFLALWRGMLVTNGAIPR